MNTLQTFVSPQKLFTLEYPRLWESEMVELIPAFFDPFEGQGALQVFSVHLDVLAQREREKQFFNFLNADDLMGKMKTFLEDQGVHFDETSMKIYQKEKTLFIPFEYYIDGRFYMVCMFEENNVFLLALYNCEGEPSKSEAQTVAEIIRSITIFKE